MDNASLCAQFEFYLIISNTINCSFSGSEYTESGFETDILSDDEIALFEALKKLSTLPCSSGTDVRLSVVR